MAGQKREHMRSETNSNRTMISEHEKVRQIARDFYVYGCYPIEEYTRIRGISKSKYTKVKLLLNDYMGTESFLSERRKGKKKIAFCRYAMHDNWENALAQTFRNHTFGNSDIVAYIQVQQLLAKRKMTIAELCGVGENEDFIPGENIGTLNAANLRNRLQDLEAWGYIHQEQDESVTYYALDEDMWEGFTDEELEGLLDYLGYLKNVVPLEMPYYYLNRKLQLYLKDERGLDLYNTVPFQFKHNHLFVILDNDILLELLRAKKADSAIVITYAGGNKKDSIESEVKVYEVIHDAVSGRQYAVCEETTSKRLFNARLDRILKVSRVPSAQEDRFTENTRQQEIEEFMDSCWCVSAAEKTQEVVIDFHFDKEKEGYIYKRIVEEGHGGYLKQLKDGCYEYRLDVQDPGEMVPWIRSFGERAEVCAPTWLREKMSREWKEALKAYENI